MFAHTKDSGQFNVKARNIWTPARRHPAAKDKPLGTAEGRLAFRASHATCRGFSMIELLLCVVVLSVILGGVLSAISQSEQGYGRTELQSDMYENVRGSAELMEQEVGQAGLVSLPATTLNAVVAIGATTATVSSTTSMYNGEQLLVDAGSVLEESVTLSANPTATTITVSPAFAHAHASLAPVTVLGAFPSGVVPPGTTDGSTSVNEPGVSVLNLVGDINSDGSLVYVRYTCDTSVTPGTLTRSITTITPGVNAIAAAQTLLSTLIPNPNNTPCFQYTTYPVTVVTAAGSTVYNFVTNVGLTISVQSLKPDPQTNQYLTMTKSFLDMSPRNVMAGFELANASLANRIQAAPPNVTLY
jgi:prepilin-type N-terminal cleavage/methylation domain-containing protein